ncbi:MAG: DUF2357 domain-containing protein [Cycloclasticus sp.]
MRLYMEVLNGKRKGQVIDLCSYADKRQNNGVIPYVLETEAISFNLLTDKTYDSVGLILENITYPFSFKGESVDDKYLYNLTPSFQKNGQYEALFYNYFGLAALAILFDDSGSVDLEEVAPFEVLARKISAEQAAKMIEFILSETNGDLNRAFGATRLGAKSVEGGEEPNKLLEQLIYNLNILEELSPYILNNPLSTLSSHTMLRDGRHVNQIQEQGVAWLIENLSVLEETDSSEQAHVVLGNTYYEATELQTSVMKEHTDIYENRVIHTYINGLLNFTKELQDGYLKQDSNTVGNQHGGYISFFSAMASSIHNVNRKNLSLIESCQERLRSLKSLYDIHIPIKGIDDAMPRISPKIKANRHYLNLYRSIIGWYQNNQVSWESQKMLLAINGIPKLFEYYTALRLKKWCVLNGETSKGSLDGEMWSGNINGNSITLHYEPVYWMAGHEKAGGIVNTENRSEAVALRDSTGSSRRYSAFSHRSPDLVLTIKKTDQYSKLIVLDAKYTSPKLAFSTYLPECTMKYLHGITDQAGNSIVTSMIILHPGSNDSFRDFHDFRFGVFSDKPQSPVIGAQSISILNANNEQGLNKLLSQLLSIASKF